MENLGRHVTHTASRVTRDTYSQLCYTWHVQPTVLHVTRTSHCVTRDTYSQLCYTWHVQL